MCVRHHNFDILKITKTSVVCLHFHIYNCIRRKNNTAVGRRAGQDVERSTQRARGPPSASTIADHRPYWARGYTEDKNLHHNHTPY